MNDVQRAAIARADAVIKPALELYNERCKLANVYYRLPIDKLRRVNACLSRLTTDDLEDVLRYAEGIALWNDPVGESADATHVPPRPPSP